MLGFVVLLITINWGCALKNMATTMLSDWPMVMVHDAATTYLVGGLLHQVNDWAKTQADGGAKGELDCGARAFDWRPKLKGGHLIMHHGSIDVNYPMTNSLDEMMEWANAHTKVEDLVVLGISHCDGGAPCEAAVQQLLKDKNIAFVSDCGELKGLTVAEASERGRLVDGGSILAIFNCWEENYDSTVACSGYGNKLFATSSGRRDVELTSKELEVLRGGGKVAETVGGLFNVSSLLYTCYEDSTTKSFPVERMLKYLANVSAAGPPESGELFAAQALWQETAASVIVSELHGSTLLLDESRSGLNKMLANRIKSGEWSGVFNFVEVNNVCDGGAELLSALRALN